LRRGRGFWRRLCTLVGLVAHIFGHVLLELVHIRHDVFLGVRGLLTLLGLMVMGHDKSAAGSAPDVDGVRMLAL
jgi:hypothetical protein